ncbi:MAG: carboxypeptidase-like regulatory domain-containing protein [bacterium]|nr:carboxypeptidase-like regulatory domain-containing protein [bacterium]
MKKRTHFFRALLSAAILLLNQCTDNPFSDTTISLPGTTIRGTVELSDGSSPDGVYVWLEGFDFGTFTDHNGRFQFKLPSPRSQAGAGITGTLKIYVYLANFNLATHTIVLRNGELDYVHSRIHENGELRNSIYLSKFLDIETDIEPTSVDLSYNGAIAVQLTLRALEDTVFVQIPDKTQGPLSILMTQKISPDQDYFEIVVTHPFALNANMVADTITMVPKVWLAGFAMSPGRFPRGKYKIVPYFLIDPRSDLPAEMLNNLGRNIDRPVSEFLKIPTKRNGGDLEVTAIN